MKRFVLSASIAAVLATITIGAAGIAAASASAITISVDARAEGTLFPHFWEQMFGSGRAVLALRDNYRKEVRLVKAVADFRYVRCHGIFDDDVGLYDVDKAGNTQYNFSYVDQIYDGLLAEGVRPFVAAAKSGAERRQARSGCPHPRTGAGGAALSGGWGRVLTSAAQAAVRALERTSNWLGGTPNARWNMAVKALGLS